MPPIDPSGGGGTSPQSLLQMASGGVPDGSGGNWAPDWVKQQLPTNLAYWASTQSAPSGGGAVDTSAAFGPGTGSQAGYLAPWLNPSNWGPPPASAATEPTVGNQGWFPPEFAHGGNDPGGKFWSQKSLIDLHNQRFPGGQPSIDERPNTLNWRMLGTEPGNFMVKGHPISQSRLFYDTHRPISEPESGPAIGGSLLPYRGFGQDSSGWSTAGQVGFPGQLDPFAVSWGAGGP